MPRRPSDRHRRQDRWRVPCSAERDRRRRGRHACHERTIDQGLAELAVPGLDRDDARAASSPTARRSAASPTTRAAPAAGGARRWRGSRASTTSSPAIARSSSATARCGSGHGRAHASRRRLETLATDLVGREVLVLGAARPAQAAPRHPARASTRRAFRRRRRDAGDPPDGATTRRQRRHGRARHGQLRARRAAPDRSARRLAQRKGAHRRLGANYVIDDATAFPALPEAIADLNWVAATTARQRDLRKPVMTPIEAVAEMRARIARGERCGVLFGRERNGLETSEVANADALVMIPVNSRFASLNLAQAVLILGLRVDARERGPEPGPRHNLRDARSQPASTWATTGRRRRRSCSVTSSTWKAELDRLGFFNPPHKRAQVVRNLRTMFSRMGATEQEVRTLRGIVATLAKGKGRGRKPPD